MFNNSGVDGLTGDEFNVVNASIPGSPRIYVDKNAKNVAPCDPDHSTPATRAKIFGLPAVLQYVTSLIRTALT